MFLLLLCEERVGRTGGQPSPYLSQRERENPNYVSSAPLERRSIEPASSLISPLR